MTAAVPWAESLRPLWDDSVRERNEGECPRKQRPLIKWKVSPTVCPSSFASPFAGKTDMQTSDRIASSQTLGCFRPRELHCTTHASNSSRRLHNDDAPADLNTAPNLFPFISQTREKDQGSSHARASRPPRCLDRRQATLFSPHGIQSGRREAAIQGFFVGLKKGIMIVCPLSLPCVFP